MIKVKNINPNPYFNCACGNWLKHWQKFSSHKTAGCAAANCTSTADTGVHVQKTGSTDENWYVLPLCNEHTAHTGELEICEDCKLVPANKELTCERW